MPNFVWPLILQILGILIILAEFIIPSFGLLTVLSLTSFGFSLYLARDLLSAQVFTVFVIADLTMIPVLIWIGVKIIANSPFALRSDLSKSKAPPGWCTIR